MQSDIRRNRIAAAIESGRKAIGVRLQSPSPAVIELLRGEGVDFIYLDCEHGAFDVHDIENACRAAELAGLTVLIRVPALDAGLIDRCLSAGVQGIIVPHVSDADQARAAVRACYFPPMGSRSSPSSRANGYSHAVTDFDRYFAEANANITLSVQLEDVAAADNVGAIAATQHISYFTIGKQDLSVSMGIARGSKGHHPEVVAAIDRMEAEIRGRGGLLKDDVVIVGRLNDFILRGVRSLREQAERPSPPQS